MADVVASPLFFLQRISDAVLFEFPVESGLSDAKEFGSLQLVAAERANRFDDGFAFEFCKGLNRACAGVALLFAGLRLGAKCRESLLLQLGGQITEVQHRP